MISTTLVGSICFMLCFEIELKVHLCASNVDEHKQGNYACSESYNLDFDLPPTTTSF